MARVEVLPRKARLLTGDLSGRTFARPIGTFELVRMVGRGCPPGHRRSAGAVKRYPFHMRPVRFTCRGSEEKQERLIYIYPRSEERRVGKECRCRRAVYDER